MNKRDKIVVGWLALLALFIWARDTSWISTSDDTLPILIAIPMYFWIQWPLGYKKETASIPSSSIILATVLFILGILFNLTFVLGLGWTALMWGWLKVKLIPEELPTAKKLLILPLMAFPWIALDAEPIGWWFRLTGAYVAGSFFNFTGYDVVREGTQIFVNNHPISVEAACSGLNTLQSMLIAGSLGAFLQLGESHRYWWNLPLLVIMAWVANTLRIIVIASAAILISHDFAMGTFHDLGGWAVLFTMFCLCWFIFSLQSDQNFHDSSDEEKKP